MNRAMTLRPFSDDEEVRRLYLEEWLGDRGYDMYELSTRPELCSPINDERVAA
jgi:hypothetical protein